MLKTILLVLLLLCSYGSKKYQTDADLKQYVELFEETYQISVNMGVIFKKQTGNIIGMCYYSSRVEIDPDYWARASELSRISLMFHELGHCILDRQHTKGLKEGSYCPVSLMNPYIFSDWCFFTYYDYYIDELIKPYNKKWY